MIILDSHVISALMRPHRSGEIQGWLDRQPAERLCTTTISVYEILAGVGMLPHGKRKHLLEGAFATTFNSVLGGRILPFDLAAAEQAAAILARRLLSGINKETRDTQIAGICLSRSATLATRNVRDFDDLDIPLVDPWAS